MSLNRNEGRVPTVVRSKWELRPTGLGNLDCMGDEGDVWRHSFLNPGRSPDWGLETTRAKTAVGRRAWPLVGLLPRTMSSEGALPESFDPMLS